MSSCVIILIGSSGVKYCTYVTCIFSYLVHSFIEKHPFMARAPHNMPFLHRWRLDVIIYIRHTRIFWIVAFKQFKAIKTIFNYHYSLKFILNSYFNDSLSPIIRQKAEKLEISQLVKWNSQHYTNTFILWIYLELFLSTCLFSSHPKGYRHLICQCINDMDLCEWCNSKTSS